MIQVILNADDFGASHSVNQAIMRAHRQGVLTSTSLMVTGNAVDEAVTMAREAPALAVGLHVVAAGGRAVLNPDQIPHIVDRDGTFPAEPLRAGLWYAFSRAAQPELAAELEAQFERFATTGLPLSHVDSHMHMHVHPTVFRLLLPLPRSTVRGACACPVMISALPWATLGSEPASRPYGRWFSASFLAGAPTTSMVTR